MKKIVIGIVLFFVLIILLEIFTTDLSEGCPKSFLLSLSRIGDKDLRAIYDDSSAFDCGIIEGRGNSSFIYECLKKADEECNNAKAYLRIQGFERFYEYYYETKDCEILIYTGGCGTSKDKCENLVWYDESGFEEKCNSNI